MNYEIEIVEGHDYSSYFWFRPVVFEEECGSIWDGTVELEEEFCIEEGDIDCFLAYFFYKYFDDELIYNRKRYEWGERVKGFQWYLTYNFFTYETLKKMIEDILETAALLETDYDNPRLDEVKKKFSIFYMCSRDDPDYKKFSIFNACSKKGLSYDGEDVAIKKHISVVIDFYHRFAKRLAAMMDNNRNTNIISIMGP